MAEMFEGFLVLLLAPLLLRLSEVPLLLRGLGEALADREPEKQFRVCNS